MNFSMTGQENGDFLIQVTDCLIEVWAGLTVQCTFVVLFITVNITFSDILNIF